MKNKKLEENVIIAINAMKKIMVLFLGPFLTAYFIKASQESIADISIYYIFSYILLAKKIIKFASIILPIVTIIISIIIMKISLPNYNEQIIFYEVLPLIVLGIYLSTSGTYYYANLRGMRDFKFLAQRNFVSSLIKIIVAIILAYTSLGIFGVWTDYLVYCFIQKYMSKRRFEFRKNKGSNLGT